MNQFLVLLMFLSTVTAVVATGLLSCYQVPKKQGNLKMTVSFDVVVTIASEHLSSNLASFHWLRGLSFVRKYQVPLNCNLNGRTDTFSLLLRIVRCSLCKKYAHMEKVYKAGDWVVIRVRSRPDMYLTSLNYGVNFQTLAPSLIVQTLIEAFAMSISIPTFQTFLQIVS